MLEKIKQTLLHAIINQDYFLVEQLIKEGENVNQVNEFGINLLQIASHRGDSEFVNLLIKHGAIVNFSTLENKETALTFAVSAGHIEIVKILLKHGADIQHKKSNGDTAMDIAMEFGHNDISILFGQEINPQLFGTSGNFQMDLLASIKRDNSVRMLRSTKRQTLTNEEISTPLEIISVGMFGGGNINEKWGNIQFQSIKTNIGYFIDFPHEEQVENPDTGNLLPLGANWLQYIGTTFSKDTPIIYTMFMGFMFLRVFNNELYDIKPRSIHKQETGKEPIVIKEPIEYNYDDKTLYDRLSFLAKEKSQIDAIDGIKDLLNKNIDINKQDQLGKTALMLACETGNKKITAYLLNNGAEVDIQDKEGFTALMLTAGKGYLIIAQQLIEHSSDINLKNYRGQDAMLFAVRNIHEAVIELLLSCGANIEILEPIKIEEEEYALEFFSKLDKNLHSKEEAIEFLIYALNVNSEQELDLDNFIHEMGSLFNVSFQPGRDEKFSSNIVQLHKDLIYKYLQTLKIADRIKNTIRCRILDLIMDKYSLGKYENSKFENVANNENEDSYEYSVKIEQKKYNIKIDIYTNSLILHTIDTDNNKSSFTYKKEGKKYFNKTRGTILIMDNKVIEQDLNGSQRISTYIKLEDGFDINDKKYIHNPKRLIEILSLFTKDNPIKYSTHSFDWGEYESYRDYMTQLKVEFGKIDFELKLISSNLHEKISKFFFDNSLGGDNTWGRYNINIGWSSHIFKEYCEKNKKPFSCPLEEKYQREISGKTISSFADIADILKNEVEIRSENNKLKKLFLKIKKDTLRKPNKPNFNLSYLNLSGKDFYTDVEYFEKGLSKIFIEIEKRRNHPNITIEVIENTDDNYIDILIIHHESTSDKSYKKMKTEIDGGEFESIRNYFSSLCDWSIEAQFSDGNYRIDYLSDTESVKHSKLEKMPLGFTHRLRFYT